MSKKFKNDFHGVYQFKNKINGKIYVGSSATVLAREHRHYMNLMSTTRDHHTVHLQRAWDEYGSGAFEHSVLEVVPFREIKTAADKSELAKLLETREQIYIDLTKCYLPEFGYNMNPKAGLSCIGIKRTDEFKEKIRQANLGRKESDETRRIKSLVATGNPNYSRPQIKGGLNILAIKILQYSKAGNFMREWDSVSDAAMHYKLKTHSNIVTCCALNINTAHGFIWRYYINDYPLVIESARKRGELFKERHGVSSDNHDKIMEKREDTSMKKHGVKHHMQLDSHKRTGSDNTATHKDVREKIGKTVSETKFKTMMEKLPGYDFVSIDGLNLTFDHIVCDHKFIISRQQLSIRTRKRVEVCMICNPLKTNQYK